MQYVAIFIFLLTLFNSLGNLYIADLYNNRVRKVAASTSVIATIAGTGLTTFSGDNGPATSATLYNPVGVAVDTSSKHVIRIDIIWHLTS